MTPSYRSYRKRSSSLPKIFIGIGIFLLAGALLVILLSSQDTVETSSPLSSPSSQPEEPSVTTIVVTPSETTQQAPSAAPTQGISPSSSSAPELPPLSEAPWQLTLANKNHPLPENWDVTTTELPNGLLVDSRIYDALTSMLNDCKAAGLDPIVCSAYRTLQKQTQLFEAKIDSFMRDGLSYDEAYLAASRIVAIPGTSEHNLGLSVDICASSYQLLDDAQAETPEQRWLMEHCVEYGFILRYPKEKQSITGIIWEPWHYRYVGVDLAREITDSGLCLEEYLALHYSFN